MSQIRNLAAFRLTWRQIGVIDCAKVLVGTNRILLAGHNKWSNIKHNKAKQDDLKCRIFSKHVKSITNAILKNGSNNPETNKDLKKAIEAASIDSVARQTIDRTLQKFADENFKTIYLEINFPGDLCVLMKIVTSRVKFSIDQIKRLCKTSMGRIDSDAIEFVNNSINFRERSFMILLVKNDIITSDDVLWEIAMELDAEEFIIISKDEKTTQLKLIIDSLSLEKSQIKLKTLLERKTSSDNCKSNFLFHDDNIKLLEQQKNVIEANNRIKHLNEHTQIMDDILRKIRVRYSEVKDIYTNLDIEYKL